jgi:hypothetical protein
VLRLQPAPFEVLVHSDPAGAAVSLDGEAKGRTPMSLKVPGTGTHQLRLVLDGYLPWNATADRRKALPDPVRLLKAGGRKGGAKKGSVQKFFTGVFHREPRP